MTGLVRKALTAAVALAVVASVASAGVPDPRTSSAERMVAGNASGNQNAGVGADGYDVVVRDVNGAGLGGRTVVIDWSADASLKVHNAQNAGITVNCAAKTISKLTDASGAVKFGPRIGDFNNGNVVQVTADGVVLATIRTTSTDLDGTGGSTGLGDLSIFSANYLNNPSAQETDFDDTGSTGLGDLSIFSAEYLSGATGTYCP
jgi:hypothetical protein